jgi:hypothetical protein
MLRVALKLVVAAAAIAAVWSFVPIGGRTLAARWQRAQTPAALVEGLWSDLRGEPAHRPSHPVQRAQARGGAPAARPTESHSEADRRALDRIVSRHLDEK